MTRSERPARPTRKRPVNSRAQGPAKGSGKAPARKVAAPQEFTLPESTTPALPVVEAFDELDMPAALLKTLVAQGVTEPFPIQAATLPNSLAGRDILGRGRTGSGKTLAFGLALLARTAGGGPSRGHRSRSFSYRPVSWRSRSPTHSRRTRPRCSCGWPRSSAVCR